MKRTAIILDGLRMYGGAERVLEQMLQVIPEADVFSVFDRLPAGEREFLRAKEVRTSFVQRLPAAKMRGPFCLLLVALGIRQFDLSGYQRIVSSSRAFAGGVRASPNQRHISYCHSPLPGLWDQQGGDPEGAGLAGGQRSWAARVILHLLRMWDAHTASRVDHFIASSRFVSRMVQKCYGWQSTILPPPVDLARFSYAKEKEGFYLFIAASASLSASYPVLEAFRRMDDLKLKVVWRRSNVGGFSPGPERNLEWLGNQPLEALRDLTLRARAVVFAADDTFWITPLEAQACGTPVIGSGKGVFRDMIMPGVTGSMYDDLTANSVCEAVTQLESLLSRDVSQSCRSNAERFSAERFRVRFAELLERV